MSVSREADISRDICTHIVLISDSPEMDMLLNPSKPSQVEVASKAAEGNSNSQGRSKSQLRVT